MKLTTSAAIFIALAIVSTELVVRLSQPVLSKNRPSAGSESFAANAASEKLDREKRGNKPRLAEAFGKVPLQFEVNEGQTDSRVKFLARGHGYGLFLTPTEAVLELRNPRPELSNDRAAGNEPERSAGRNSKFETPTSYASTLRMKVVGGTRHAQLKALNRLSSATNYFLGDDPKQWRTDIGTYSKVEYKNIYRGVDLVFYGNQQQLEYDFKLAAGVNPGKIRLRFEGAQHLQVDDRGNLILRTRAGDVRLEKPNVYQEDECGTRAIAGSFLIREGHQIGFQIGEYDRTKPLVIDPTISYSNVFGGSFNDQANSIAVDSTGNAYAVGTTFSLNFPVLNSFQSTLNGGFDAFVTKVSPTGALVYSTYLGGTSDDQGRSIAIDPSGAAYVTGLTRSTNFPVASPLQASNAGGFTDVFLTKINPSGSGLVYSTYVGGTDQESGGGIAVDTTGNAYVTGYTQSSTFPTKAGSFQTTFGGGTCFSNRPCADAFVLKVNQAGTAFVYSTFLGGNSNDNLDFAANQFGSIAVDGAGSAYLTGITSSTNFPTSNPVQSACNSCSSFETDAFVTKLNPAGTGLSYSTYLGGTGIEVARGIALDSSGSAYVTGSTGSSDFPTTSGAFQMVIKGGFEGFVTKFSPGGSPLTYSTLLAGSGDDTPQGIAVDASGSAYITGTTNSSDFPLSNAIQAKGGGGLFKTTNGGTSWTVSNTGLTYLNNAIAVDPTNRNRVYSANGFGVSRSTDGGNTWTPTTFNTFSAFSIVLDPNNPSVIYAGSVNAVGKSTDAGNTWTTNAAGFVNAGIVEMTAIDPTNSSILYAGTSNGGVLKSMDGGINWTPMNSGITNLFILSLAVDRMNPATLFVGNSAGVLKSTNGGVSWINSSTGLPTGSGRSVTGFAFDPTTTSTIFATTAAIGSTQGGVFKSMNGGGTWTSLVRTDFSLGSMVIDSNNSSTLYVATNANTNTGLTSPGSGVGILKSTNGGATWTPSGLTQDFIQGLTFDPANSSTIYAPATGGNDAFVSVLNNAGSNLGFSSYLGGTGAELGNAIALDSTPNVYVAGATASTDFPQRNPPSPSTEHDTIPLRQPDDDFLVALKLAFGCPDLSLTPTLPDGSEGSFYNQAVTVSGGLPGAGYTFSVSGDLPPGLKITSNISSSAVIFGEPTTPGTYTFAIIATDTNGCMVNRVYTITIATRPPLLGQNDGSNGDPISTATGEVFDFFDFDLYVRGPMALRFSRYYSSASSTTGLVNSSLGNNWMHNYDLRLDLNGTSATVVYELGQPVIFKLSGGTWNLGTTDSLIYQLVQSGSSFRFFDPSSNIIYTFNTSAGGRLERIEDRYGSVLTLTYIGSLLSRVADGLGRTIDFTYSSGHLASVQDQSGRIVLFSYSGNNLTGATDAAGKTTLYSYTAVGSRVGLLVSSTRPRGNTPYTQAFDSNARVLSQTDAAGNTTSFAYNVPSPGSTTLTDPLAHTRLFRHQGGRNMIEQKDEAGNSVLLSYDGQNRKTSVTDRNGNTTTYNYHSGSGLLASITYPNASTLICTYIATTVNGFTFYDLTRAVYPDGADERFTYDPNGNVASKTDRTGQTWQFNYNSRGQVLTASIPTGGVVALTYNSDGTLASYQPPNAGPVTYTYDSVKRPITRRQANGSTRSWTWDARGRIVSFTNERGATVTATYDNNSQLATLTDPAGGRIAFTYTGTEHVAQVTDQMGQIVTLSYDARDRLMSATYPDGAVIRYAYDVIGFLSSITDGEGKVWQINHDHEGRETSFITPLGNRTDFARSPLGQISGATTPLGNQFGLTHDAFGRLATVVDPLSNTTRFNYDARGDLSAFTLANGIVASYTRNSLQKITQVTDPRGNKWNYSFDAAGRLLSATDPLGNTMTYTRDVRGRISQVALPGGGSVATTTDGSGRLTRSGFSDGTTLDYTYDSRALLTSATGITLQRDARGDITSSNGVEIERDSLGRISKVTFAAGKAVTYSYDRRDLLTKVQDFVGGVTTFTYDDDSRLVMIARPNGTATTYSYDAEGNAGSINESSGGNSLASTLLVRDKDGQITQATRNVPLNPTGQQLLLLNGSRSFDAASQVAAFSYDGLGRRTSDNRRSYSWNLASRLQSYTAGVETAQFTYDALRQMLSQTSGGVTRQFVWNYAFALPSISVIKQGGSDLRYYVHTPDGELLYSIEASDNSRRFFHFDEMGNTLFLTNDAAAVTDSYAYAPYGTLLASAGTTDNPFTFEGRYGVMRIGVSGLYYIRQRFYDSLNASFISRDSLARIEPGMINPYQYAADNPLVFFDATGGEPSSAGSTAGTTAVDVIGNAGGAAGIVGAGLGSKAQAINNLVDAIGDGVPAVGGLVGKSDSVLANVNYLTKLTTKGEKLSKLAKPFKKLGNLGTAAQVFEVGLNGYNHYTADQKVMQEAEDERTRILWTYGVQANNILELFREKKIGEVQRNRLLLQAQFDMEEALLVAGFEEDFGIFFNMTVAFKNGAETFVPVPLSSIPNPFENKPLIDFGAGEFLLK